MHPIQEAQVPCLVGELIYTLHAAGHHWKKKKKTNTVVSIVKVLVIQACPTLCDPMDYSLRGSSIHGIFKARILKWAAISFSRGSSQPRDRTWVSHIVGRCFTVWAKKTKGKLQFHSCLTLMDARIFQSSQLEASYVGDLLYSKAFKSHWIVATLLQSYQPNQR